MIFKDRKDAGRFLADRLASLATEDPIVLGLPRGGVPVAFEIATALDAPLEVVVARKLGAPMQPEFGFGAIAGNEMVLDHESVAMLGLSEEQIETIADRERQEAGRREQLFRRGRGPLNLEGRTVIIVDDGLATGVTARAACKAIRARHPKRTVFAAPVCAAESAAVLEDFVNEVFCGYVPERFMAVGQWYENFDQTTDEEVIALLEEANAPPGQPAVNRSASLQEGPPP